VKANSGVPVVGLRATPTVGLLALASALCGCATFTNQADLPTSLLPATTADHHSVRVQLRFITAALDSSGGRGLQSIVLAPETDGGAVSGKPEVLLIDGVDVTPNGGAQSPGEAFRSIRNANGQITIAPSPLTHTGPWPLGETGGSIGWRARPGSPLRIANWRNANQEFGDLLISYGRIGLLPEFRVLQMPAVEANRGDLSRFRLVLAGLPEGTLGLLELGLTATRDPLLRGGESLSVSAGRTGLSISTPTGYLATVRASGTYSARANAQGYVDLDFSELNTLPKWYVLSVDSYEVSVTDPA